MKGGVPEGGSGVGEKTLTTGSSEGDCMRTDKVGRPDDEHDLGRQVLKDIVDGVEVSEVLLPQFLSFLGSDGLANAFVAVGRPMQEDQRKVLEVFMDIQLFSVEMHLRPFLQDQTHPQAAKVGDGLRRDRPVESVVE